MDLDSGNIIVTLFLAGAAIVGFFICKPNFRRFLGKEPPEELPEPGVIADLCQQDWQRTPKRDAFRWSRDESAPRWTLSCGDTTRLKYTTTLNYEDNDTKACYQIYYGSRNHPDCKKLRALGEMLEHAAIDDDEQAALQKHQQEEQQLRDSQRASVPETGHLKGALSVPAPSGGELSEKVTTYPPGE